MQVYASPQGRPGRARPPAPSLPLLGGSWAPLDRGAPTPVSAPGAAARPCSPGARPAPPRRLPGLPPPPASRDTRGGGQGRARAGVGEARREVLPGQRAGKMAAPMELFCWAGGWGLPSVDLDSLAVLVRVAPAPSAAPWRTREGASEFCRGASARAQWGKLRPSKSVGSEWARCPVP